VITFANQIGNHPVLLAQLNGVHREAKQLGPPKPTSDEKRKHRAIALAAQRIGTGSLKQPLPLLGSQPVANSYSQPVHSLDTPNASGQFWTEQA